MIPKQSITVFLLFMVLHSSLSAAIVFDGKNSYSSYAGEAHEKTELFERLTPGQTFLLQEISPGQIDYTTEDKINISRLTDENGMILQVEGFYSFKVGKYPPMIEPSDDGRMVVTRLRESAFCFLVKVLQPGFYSFAIDASQNFKEADGILKLYAIDDNDVMREAKGSWSSYYKTKGWTFFAENYGGRSIDDPFFVELYLDRNTTTLLFSFEPKRAFNMDAVRIVDFKTAGLESIDTGDEQFIDDLKKSMLKFNHQQKGIFSGNEQADPRTEKIERKESVKKVDESQNLGKAKGNDRHKILFILPMFVLLIIIVVITSLKQK